MARPSHTGINAPILLFVGMAVFGSATPVSKIVGGNFPPMLAGLLRVVLGSAILAVAAARRWRDVPAIGRADGCASPGSHCLECSGSRRLCSSGCSARPVPSAQRS
jgi:hypothetical protein